MKHRLLAQTTPAEQEGGVFNCVAFTSEVNFNRERIDFDSMVINPAIAGFGSVNEQHSGSATPIGRVVDVAVNEQQVDMRFRLDIAHSTQARLVHEAILTGAYSGVSIEGAIGQDGYREIIFQEDEDGQLLEIDHIVVYGLVFQTLSIVTNPAYPSANIQTGLGRPRVRTNNEFLNETESILDLINDAS